MKEFKEDVIFQAYSASSERNQSFMVVYILILLYVFISIATTSDSDLLFVDGKLNLPAINTPVPVVIFYFVVPVIVLVGHYIFLLNISAHIEIARKWRRIDNKMTIVLPFIINHLLFSMQMDSINGTSRIRFIVSLMCIMVPALALTSIQVRFSDYHSLTITIFHFAIIVMDVYFINAFLKKANIIFNETWKLVGFSFLFASILNLFATGLSILNPDSISGHENYFFIPKINVTNNNAALSNDEIKSSKPNHSGIDLSNRNLQFSHITGVNIDKAEISNTDFSYALIRDSSAVDSHIKDSIFDHAQLHNVDLSKSKIENVSAKNTLFPKTNLSNVSIINVNLEGSTLKDANINEAFIDESDLSLADLSGMLINGASFYNTKALGINLSHVELKGVIFNKVDASGSTLLSASLKGSNIGYSDFRYSNLNKISVIASVLAGNKLQGIQILEGDISYSFLFNNNMYGATVYRNKCQLYLNGFEFRERNKKDTTNEVNFLDGLISTLDRTNINSDTKISAKNRLQYVKKDFLGISGDVFIEFIKESQESASCQIINENQEFKSARFSELYDGLISMSCDDKWVSRGIYRNYFSNNLLATSQAYSETVISPYNHKFIKKIHDNCPRFSSFVTGFSHSENRSLAQVKFILDFPVSYLP